MGKKNSEVENEVYHFIKILIIVVVFLLGAYLFTNSFVNKEYNIKNDGQKGVVSTHNIIVGSLLNRPYEEYYVLAYNSNDNSASLYETFLNLYENKEGSLRIYVIDLDNSLNKEFYSENSNPKAKTIDELKISNPTLFKIKNKEIAKYIEGKEEIKKELGL